MRSRGFLFAAILLMLVTIYPLLLAADPPPRQIPLLEGEHWWAGIISQSHLMPFTTASEYEFDFHNDTAGNQAQPLLISDKGRYVWSENAFRFRFNKGVLQIWAPAGDLKLGSSLSSLKDAFQKVSQAYFPPSGQIPHPTLFTHPQFNTWIEMTYNQNQKDILQYAHNIINQGFSPGVLMIDEGWFRTYGDWDFDCARFENPRAMMDELHRMGFKVMLWVCPYITPAGTFFTSLRLDSTEKKTTVWIRNAKNPAAPAIMEWWDGFSAVVDLTSPEGIRWFKGKLDRLVNAYGVDGFKFDGGDAEYCSPRTMLNPTLSFQPQATPNQHSEAFARLGLAYPMNEFRACWKMGGQAIAQRLRDKEHNWIDLGKLIPGILNQGLMGYPFTCPDLIGGGEFLSFRNLENVDQELIVRAAQCHALMPMMQFSVAPWRVLSREKLEICLQMARLHTGMGEEILALAKESAQTGSPIVRAMEYEYPGHGYGGITDQFLLGPSILVAPVLQRGAMQKTIQFPPGTWKGDDGSVVKGPCRIEVSAPLSRLPWYRKAASVPGP
jgi:alpha-glucosidase (family GH31 glycosyl hydrolase)